jgi:hypothetical protein
VTYCPLSHKGPLYFVGDCKHVFGKFHGKRSLGSYTRCRWKNKITQRPEASRFEIDSELAGSTKGGEYLDQHSYYQLRKKKKNVNSADIALVDIKSFVGFEASTAVTMKNTIFCDVAPHPR